jgi:hypothetical protein
MVAQTDAYYSATTAAKELGCSRSSVCRAAKSHGVGIFTNGRLAVLSKSDVSRIKELIHETPGNPFWIAARGRKLRPGKKKKKGHIDR